MNVLVTGINARVGHALVQLLQNTHRIFGVPEEVDGLDLPIELFDCNQFESNPKMDAYIHTAGKSMDTMNYEDSLTYFEKNVGVVRRVFQCFLRSEAKAFVFLSSSKVLAGNPNRGPMDESVEPEPMGPLGESMFLAEQYLLKTAAPSKRVYVIRPGLLHGEGFMVSHNSTRLLSFIKATRLFPFGQLSMERSVLCMDNLHAVIEGLMVAKAPSGVYHVCDDQSVSLQRFRDLIATAMQKKVWIYNCNSRFSLFLIELTSLHWSKKSREILRYYLRKNYLLNNQRVLTELGWSQMPFDAEVSLLKTIKSLL